MFNDKVKNFRSVFKSTNRDIKEINDLKSFQDKETTERKIRISSFLDSNCMNTLLGKKLSYGRKVDKKDKFFFENQLKLENFIQTKYIFNKSEIINSTFPYNSYSLNNMKQQKEKTPTHYLIPYSKRKNEEFKQSILITFKEKINKSINLNDELPTKRIKINSKKKMNIKEMNFEYIDDNQKRYKNALLFNDSEVGFEQDWQEYIITAKYDEDIESEEETIQSGIKKCINELQKGLVEFLQIHSNYKEEL